MMEGVKEMKNKKISVAVSLLVVGLLTNGMQAKADDDDYDHDGYEHEKYEKYDDHDDDYDHNDDDDYDYEYEDDYDDDDDQYENYDTTNVVNEKGKWNIWTRSVVVDKEALPFTDSKQVVLKVTGTNKEVNLFAMPKDGEIFVPGKTVAKLLGATATYYKTSEILVIQNANHELIYRAGKNVAYDNYVKTPLPAHAFYLNNELYLPISAITNGLGFIAEWQEENQQFVCQPLN